MIPRFLPLRRFAAVLTLTLAGLVLSACQPLLPAPSPMVAAMASAMHGEHSIVRVNVSGQGVNFHRPWQLEAPFTRKTIGVILSGNRILTPALPLANSRYIEIETLDTNKKVQARIQVIDYEADLALLTPVDDHFLDGTTPLSLDVGTRPGDAVTVLQVKPNGDVVPGTGLVTGADVSMYLPPNAFLVYRVNTVIAYRSGNLALPAMRNGRLIGLLIGYDSRSQTGVVLPSPVIQHFLTDAATAKDGHYRGFPTAGFFFGPTVDPQLRRYIGLPADAGGVYVQRVIKGSPADRAGLKDGDVILRVGDTAVSDRGTYEDPKFGKLSIVNRIRLGYQVGQTLPLTVFRDGKTLTIPVELDHRSPEEYLVPPYVFDRPPHYLIVGGFVIQELTQPYLQAYGKNWTTDAPIHLVYYDQNQNYLDAGHREKIVILSSVIPNSYTIGYENLANLVITRINGRKIRKLADVKAALAAPINGFDKFEFDQHPRVVYLDVHELPAIHRQIRERYRINSHFVD